MIASLPMYDGQATGWLYDELWHDLRDALRAQGIEAPDELTRSGDPWADWQDPGLLISQTCGLPFRAKLHETLTLVAAPALWVPDFYVPASADRPAEGPVPCPPGRYYSIVVAHKNDNRREFKEFDGAHLAYNDALSQSGWGLLAQLCDAEGVSFGRATRTGAHRASALAVVKGRADIAAIDVATWFGPLSTDRWTKDLRVVTRTPQSPALPFVTAFPDLKDALFQTLQSVMAYRFDGSKGLPSLQDALNIAPEGVVPARLDDYLAIPLPPAPPPEN